MSFNVDFYVFSKKTNSTARPTATPTTHACVLKEDSSIASPVLLLNLGLSNAPAWNYCYIAAYGRYYFINNWIWTNDRLWQANLVTDLLATFKTQIGAANLYVLRSASDYDGTIVDNYYPVKAVATRQYVYAAYQWPLQISGGCIIVGVVSKAATIGSVCYYALTLGNFAAFIQAMLDDTILTNFDPDDASLALQKALVDPLQYVKSAVYLPIPISDIAGSSAQVSVWDWDTGVNAKKVDMSVPWSEFSFTLTVPAHPLAATRGAYLNTSPYTRATFEFIPFGSFDIDTTLTAGNSTITVTYLIDWINGTGTLQASCGNTTLGTLSAQIGVPVQISQVTKDYLGAAVGAVSTIGSVVDGILSGNWGGAITGAASGIGNGIQSIVPRSSHVSSNGSYSHYHWFPALYVEFYTPVDEDLAHAGRPLCQNRTIGNLSGFIMVKDGELDLPALAGEEEEIRAYLEGGFFYD